MEQFDPLIVTADTLVRLVVMDTLRGLPTLVGALIVGLTVAYCHAVWSTRKK